MPDVGHLALFAFLLATDPRRALLERAIEAAGGARALAQARALVWEGQATVHTPAREVKIVGIWRLEPPEAAIVETHIAGQDPTTTRSMIISRVGGWMQQDGHITRLPSEMVAHERDQFYLYALLRLVPLREAPFALAPAPPLAGEDAGLRVTHPDRPVVDLYFDSKGRPRRLLSEVTDPGSGARRRQEVVLSGDITVAGIRWPRRLHITWDGQAYFDLTIVRLQVLPRLVDGRLAGPKPQTR